MLPILNQSMSGKNPNSEHKQLLDDLQGNILKGHGRYSTLNIFIRLGSDIGASRRLVRELGALTMSAHRQLLLSDEHKADPTKKTEPFVTVLLAMNAYGKLDHADWCPGDIAYRQGMAARGLNDDPALVEPGFIDPADILVIIAADPDGADRWTSADVDAVGTKVANLVSLAQATVLVDQPGRAIFRNAGGDASKREGIEHFGYVDGRSQPLFLDEDVAHERDHMGGIDQWNPRFPLSQVLVADPAGRSAQAFGSYFVFRKLEQHVAAFKAAEAGLSARLNGIAGDHAREDEDFAGASIVGRFEDGTPIESAAAGKNQSPVPNNFNYDTDDGRRCPHHAHIRKTNPRKPDRRGAIMARRGITFGVREAVVDAEDLPAGGVGLLFMAYQASLSDQFEVTQKFWSDDPDFEVRGTGVDPVTGQPSSPAARAPLNHNVHWNDGHGKKAAAPFGGHVTFRGGGYFFAPARSTLLAM